MRTTVGDRLEKLAEFVESKDGFKSVLDQPQTIVFDVQGDETSVLLYWQSGVLRVRLDAMGMGYVSYLVDANNGNDSESVFRMCDCAEDFFASEIQKGYQFP